MFINYDDPPEDDLVDDDFVDDNLDDDSFDIDGDVENENGEENLETSPQDPTKPTEPAKDPKAVVPVVQPKLTPQEIEAKYNELLAESELLKPYKELNEQVGAYEAIQPAIELYGLLAGGEFNAPQALELMNVLNPEATRAITWQLVDNEQDAIVNDPKIREAVLASDENFQNFLKWQETGELPTDKPVDAKTKELQDRLDKIDKENQEAAARQAKADEEAKIQRTQEAVTAYDNAQLKWVDDQIAALKWDEQYKEDADEVKDVALHRFNNDPAARHALNYARTLDLRSKANPKDQKLKQMSEAANKRVRHIFTQKLKPIIEKRNKYIQGAHKTTQAQRAKQQSRPVLGNSGANVTTKDVLSGLSNADERLEALIDDARANGAFGDYKGY